MNVESGNSTYRRVNLRKKHAHPLYQTISSSPVSIPLFWQKELLSGKKRRDATQRVSSSAQSRTSGRCTERPRGLDTSATAVEKKHKELRLNYTSVSG